MRSILFAAAAAAAALAAATVQAQAVAPSRGALLYNNHCIECHSTQMHWRDQRLAVDWPTLKEQVRRFQGMAALDWSDEDITAVARHLNDTIYRFPAPPLARR